MSEHTLCTLKGNLLIHKALMLLGVISTSHGYRYRTHTAYRFTGYIVRTIYTRDWLLCLSTCYNNPSCGSYNFNQQDGVCELNIRRNGDEYIMEAGKLNREPWMFFQQIKVRFSLQEQRITKNVCE